MGTDDHPFGPSFRPLSPRQAEQIAGMGDTVRRNLRITQGYHDLKLSMTWLLGCENVSWCAFATWASRSAGHFIRGDFVPDLVEACLDRIDQVHRRLRGAYRLLTRDHGGMPAARSVLVTTIERVCRQVRESVGLGNRIVFEELAPLFARMVEMFRGATTYDARAIQRFLSVLRPGPTTEGGQDLLIEAFGNYYEAMFARHPKQRAERILLANTQIGYHEQTRLQGPIMGALNAPVADFILEAAHAEARSRRARGLVHQVIDRTLRPLASWFQEEWYAVATRRLIRLEVPRHSLHLGEDLPGPSPVSMFPEELTTIESDDLAALLYRLDLMPNTLAGSAARNWGDLADRMNYVVDFFRAYQQDHSLYRAPFTRAQVAVIRAGGIPDGPL